MPSDKRLSPDDIQNSTLGGEEIKDEALKLILSQLLLKTGLETKNSSPPNIPQGFQRMVSWVENISDDSELAQLRALLEKANRIADSISDEVLKEKREALFALQYDLAFEMATFSEITNLKRYVDKRNALLREHEFVSNEQAAKILGLEGNYHRSLQRMRERDDILSVQYGRAYLYPLFQFNNTADIYPALQANLSRLSTTRSGWEICFWLLNPQYVPLENAVPSGEALAIAREKAGLEGMNALRKAAAKQSTFIKDTPLAVLQAGKNEHFTRMVDYLVDQENIFVAKKMVNVEE